MKRTFLIFFTGLLLALGAFCVGFRAKTTGLPASHSDELAWLKTEFQINAQDFDQIARLHAEYKPHCKEMCRRIDQHDKRVRQLLAATNSLTPELESLLREGAQLRAECQRDMLKHFYAVSRQMPPQQAKRYLDWVCRETSVVDSSMQRPD